MIDLLEKFRVPIPEREKRAPIDAVFGKSPVAWAEGVFSDVGDRHRGQPIPMCADLERVLAIPRRPRPADFSGVIARWTHALGKGAVNCDCRQEFGRACAHTLKGIQAWGLEEIAVRRGLLGPIGVGDGKTLLDLLAPMVMPECKVAVLLIPPGLRKQLEIDVEFYGRHWNLPNITTGRWFYPGRPALHVVAYSELSGPKSTDLLDRIGPDLIVADEAHNIRRPESARTKRFIRYFVDHPGTRLCAWSGSLTTKSIRDYAVLSNLALRDGAPTPHHWPTVEAWAGAIDPTEDFPTPIGALARLCSSGEHIYSGWQRRLSDTPGVVSSAATMSCTAALVIRERPVAVPSKVMDAVLQVHRTWQRPDGEELVSAADKARCARELASGFFYRWRWPRMEPEEVIFAWLEARKAWHKELRERLKHSREHMDSPLLCAKAAIRFYSGYKGELPVWEAKTWPRWVEVRDTAKPETEAVWVDDFLVRDAAEWGRANVGIVWYEHDAFGPKVAELGSFPIYGPGPDAAREIARENGRRTVVASLRSHREGRNLQMFRAQLVANCISDGGAWEQLLGRTHRQGQEADEVTCDLYRHTDDVRQAFSRARQLAEYIQGTTGNAQRLLRATLDFRP